MAAVTEKFKVAVVAIQFIDVEHTDGTPAEDDRMEGRTVIWGTEDVACAETLVGQLRGLLGEPYAEAIQPETAYGLIKGLGPWWPGQVGIVHEEET